MMYYRYETHCHCAQCSACGRSTPQQLVRDYHAAGYAGLVLTDHFLRGNTAVDRMLPWAEKMHFYYNAYLNAKAVGDALDFDVLFGLEDGFGHGKEILLYNIDLEFLLQNPDLCDISLEALIARVHQHGGLVIQAHPYRRRDYIDPAIAPRDDIVDGFEIYNSKNSPADNLPAFRLAQQRQFLMTSGGDIHNSSEPGFAVAGMAFPYRVRTGAAFVDALRRGDGRCIVNGQIIQLLRDDLFY